MALVLDATPGGIASNSFATRAEADSYHDGHFYASAWIALTPSQRETLLVMATRLLDNYAEWQGSKTNRTQALRWPRRGVVDADGTGSVYDPYTFAYTLDSTTIPRWLKNATAELARTLAEANRTAESDMLEFSEISIGSLSLTKDTQIRKDVIPESVRMMIEPYGSVATSGGIGFARLVRA